jgi:hypothetical protein
VLDVAAYRKIKYRNRVTEFDKNSGVLKSTKSNRYREIVKGERR